MTKYIYRHWCSTYSEDEYIPDFCFFPEPGYIETESFNEECTVCRLCKNMLYKEHIIKTVMKA